MSVMDNFRQAAKELFGLGGTEQMPDPTAEPVFAAEDTVLPADELFGTAGEDSTGWAVEHFTPAPEHDTAPRRETSFLSKGLVVSGNIRTDGNLELLGRVDGNITAEGDVAVGGRVLGNISGSRLGLYDCRVKGNLHADTAVIINAGAVVVGDVATKNLVLDGKVKGDLAVDEALLLKKDAYLLGDITAQSISVESGAMLSGSVSTLHNAPNREHPFDDLWPA